MALAMAVLDRHNFAIYTAEVTLKEASFLRRRAGGQYRTLARLYMFLAYLALSMAWVVEVHKGFLDWPTM